MSQGVFVFVLGVFGLGMGLGFLPGVTWVNRRYVEPSNKPVTRGDRLLITVSRWISLGVGAVCVVVGIGWMLT